MKFDRSLTSYIYVICVDEKLILRKPQRGNAVLVRFISAKYPWSKNGDIKSP